MIHSFGHVRRPAFLSLKDKNGAGQVRYLEPNWGERVLHVKRCQAAPVEVRRVTCSALVGRPLRRAGIGQVDG